MTDTILSAIFGGLQSGRADVGDEARGAGAADEKGRNGCAYFELSAVDLAPHQSGRYGSKRIVSESNARRGHLEIGPAVKTPVTALLGTVATLHLAIGTAAQVDQRALDAVAAPVNSEMQRIMDQSAASRPDLPPAEAIRQKAVETGEQRLASLADVKKKALAAAGMFWGYYLANTRTRDELCKSVGVDIRPFVSAFSEKHQREVERATALWDGRVDQNQLYSAMRPTAERAVRTDMDDIMKSERTDLPGACRLVAELGAALADQMHLSQAQPAVYQALHAKSE